MTSGASLYGDLMAIVNLGLWTVYFIKVKHLRNDGVHAPSFVAAVFLVAAVCVTPWALANHGDLGAVHGSDWWLLLAMVVGPGVLGHGLMTWAQRHLDITLASLLTLGQPPLTALGAWFIFNERLETAQLVGACVVMAALTMIVADVRASLPTVKSVLPAAAE